MTSETDGTELDRIIPVDLRHTITLDDAVLELLGITYETVLDCDGEPYTPTLDEFLYNIQEDADVRLAQAEYALWEHEKENSQRTTTYGQTTRKLKAKIRKVEKALNKAQEQSRRGQELYQRLSNDVAKAKSGIESLIVIDTDETARIGPQEHY